MTLNVNPVSPLASRLGLGQLSDSGTARTIHKRGAGELSLDLSTGPGNTVAATTVNVQAGTLSLTNNAAGQNSLGNASVTLSGGTLNIVTAATTAPMSWQSGLLEGRLTGSFNETGANPATAIVPYRVPRHGRWR